MSRIYGNVLLWLQIWLKFQSKFEGFQIFWNTTTTCHHKTFTKIYYFDCRFGKILRNSRKIQDLTPCQQMVAIYTGVVCKIYYTTTLEPLNTHHRTNFLARYPLLSSNWVIIALLNSIIPVQGLSHQVNSVSIKVSMHHGH